MNTASRPTIQLSSGTSESKPAWTSLRPSESPLDPGLVLVGTDDGNVQLTSDGCYTWTNLTGNFPGAPANWWVSRVELSRHDAQRAYVSFTGYREDGTPILSAPSIKGAQSAVREEVQQGCLSFCDRCRDRAAVDLSESRQEAFAALQIAFEKSRRRRKKRAVRGEFCMTTRGQHCGSVNLHDGLLRPDCFS